jgi:hypothetical protein
MSAIDIYELDGFKKNYIESKFQEIETSFGRRLKGLINRIESKEGIYSYKKYVKKHLMNIMLLFYFRANKEVEELCKLDNHYLEKLSEKIFKNYKFFNSLLFIYHCDTLHIRASPLLRFAVDSDCEYNHLNTKIPNLYGINSATARSESGKIAILTDLCHSNSSKP